MNSLMKEAEDLMFGYVKTCLLYCAINLRIFDRLSEKRMTAEELAVTMSCDKDHLRRVCRALTTVGLLKKENEHFLVTPFGELFKQDGKHLYAFHANVDQHILYKQMSLLSKSVETGKPMFDIFNGVNFFEYLNANENAGKMFHCFMREITKRSALDIVNIYDFERFELIVDVGGGKGELLVDILSNVSKAKGILFDQEAVTTDLLTDSKGVNDRISVVNGDFFEFVPPGGDCYIMKNVVHDWNDEDALKILRNVRNAMKANGKALIVDKIVDLRNDFVSSCFDFYMMSIGGKERTEKEFRTLIDQVGLKITRIVYVKHPIGMEWNHLIEMMHN